MFKYALESTPHHSTSAKEALKDEKVAEEEEDEELGHGKESGYEYIIHSSTTE